MSWTQGAAAAAVVRDVPPSEQVLQRLLEEGADRAAVCREWLEETFQCVEELQGDIVEINFVSKDSPNLDRPVVLAQLQRVLWRSTEFLRALQVLAEFDPAGFEGEASSTYAELSSNLDRCREEASRLIDHFCIPGVPVMGESIFDSLVRGTCLRRESCFPRGSESHEAAPPPFDETLRNTFAETLATPRSEAGLHDERFRAAEGVVYAGAETAADGAAGDVPVSYNGDQSAASKSPGAVDGADVANVATSATIAADPAPKTEPEGQGGLFEDCAPQKSCDTLASACEGASASERTTDADVSVSGDVTEAGDVCNGVSSGLAVNKIAGGTAAAITEPEHHSASREDAWKVESTEAIAPGALVEHASNKGNNGDPASAAMGTTHDVLSTNSVTASRVTTCAIDATTPEGGVELGARADFVPISGAPVENVRSADAVKDTGTETGPSSIDGDPGPALAMGNAAGSTDAASALATEEFTIGGSGDSMAPVVVGTSSNALKAEPAIAPSEMDTDEVATTHATPHCSTIADATPGVCATATELPTPASEEDTQVNGASAHCRISDASALPPSETASSATLDTTNDFPPTSIPTGPASVESDAVPAASTVAAKPNLGNDIVSSTASQNDGAASEPLPEAHVPASASVAEAVVESGSIQELCDDHANTSCVSAAATEGVAEPSGSAYAAQAADTLTSPSIPDHLHNPAIESQPDAESRLGMSTATPSSSALADTEGTCEAQAPMGGSAVTTASDCSANSFKTAVGSVGDIASEIAEAADVAVNAAGLHVATHVASKALAASAESEGGVVGSSADVALPREDGTDQSAASFASEVAPPAHADTSCTEYPADACTGSGQATDSPVVEVACASATTNAVCPRSSAPSGDASAQSPGTPPAESAVSPTSSVDPGVNVTDDERSRSPADSCAKNAAPSKDAGAPALATSNGKSSRRRRRGRG